MVGRYARMQRALVYNGPGAGSRSVNSAMDALRRSFVPGRIQVDTIDARSVVSGGWQHDCLCFVMPGGADVPYCRELGPEGMKVIRSWVEEDGGLYLGLCAGAYFASGRVVFEPGSHLEVIGERFLKFYTGTACGAVYPGFCYETERGSIAAPIRYLDWEESIDMDGNIKHENVQWRMCKDYVNGGPYWLCQNDANEVLRINSVHQVLDTVDILATYPERNHAVSAMKCSVGNGRAVLCSSHPELDSALFLHGDVAAISDHLAAQMESKDLIMTPDNHSTIPSYYTRAYFHHIQSLVDQLDSYSLERRALWNLLLAAGGLKSHLQT